MNLFNDFLVLKDQSNSLTDLLAEVRQLLINLPTQANLKVRIDGKFDRKKRVEYPSHLDLTDNAKLILGCLAKKSYLTQDDLCQETELGPQTVLLGLDNLIKQKLVDVGPSYDKNRYSLSSQGRELMAELGLLD